MRSSFAMQMGIWVIAAILPGQVAAQGPSQQRQPQENAWKILVDRGASSTWQALKKLQPRASLLMIVAHPDDEDGGTLTYESRGLGARTDLLTLNRGEGGANVMSA